MAAPTISDTARPPLSRPVLTIGTFDGVHLGHRAILAEVMRHAAELSGESVVVTFEPHPRQVLQPDANIQILTPLEDKLQLIREAGIGHVEVTPFTKAFSELSAEEYVADFLVAQFRPAAVVIGYDHRFGHDRRGDIAALRRYGGRYGFAVHEIPARMIEDAAVSSTKIRAALRAGDVGAAAQMLGRPYTIKGTVVQGQQLGRTLGYPTANVQPLAAAQLVSAQGVYAARMIVDGETHGAMLSIGTRPTVSSDGSVSIEAYLFDFSRDIYGAEVAVEFVQRMRDELKFDSLDALTAAMREDERVARGILSAL